MLKNIYASFFEERLFISHVILSTFLSLLIISPMLESEYTNDNAFNSLVQGAVTLTHQNVLSYAYGHYYTAQMLLDVFSQCLIFIDLYLSSM